MDTPVIVSEIISKPSPNFDLRPAKTPIDTVIIHYTGMESAEDALERLVDNSADARTRGRVSAHYMINEQGQVYALVEEKYRAWHAGESFFRGVKSLNNNSIGIELVNQGHYIGYTAFPREQMVALVELCKQIEGRHPIERNLVLGHSDIAPDRKIDPGEKFDWKFMAKAGFGYWPEPEKQDYTSAQMYVSSPATLRGALIKHGYTPDVTTEVMCQAFNRHYGRSADPALSMEVAAKLAWLNRKTLIKAA